MQGSFKVVCSIFDKNHDQAPKGEKLTGSNKLLFFAIAEDLDENYNNVRIVVQKLKLSEIKCCYAADLKLINCLLGISSHSGKHACPFCEGEMSLEVGQLRTFGNLNFWHNKLKEDAEKSRNPESFIKRNMKNYMNVVNECMLRGDPETTILSTIPLPELHLLMGLGVDIQEGGQGQPTAQDAHKEHHRPRLPWWRPRRRQQYAVFERARLCL